MELKRLFQAVLGKFWLIIILSAIGGLIAWFQGTHNLIKLYQAETTVYAINKGSNTTAGEGLHYEDIMVGQQFVMSYGSIINSRKVTSYALTELKGMNLSEDELAGMVKFNISKDSGVMNISAVSPDPATAAAVANAMSKGFINQIYVMTNSNIVGILDEAKVPKYPIPVETKRGILIGILAGFAFSLGLIYVIEFFDTSIREVNEVEKNVRLRVIGMIPEHRIK